MKRYIFISISIIFIICFTMILISRKDNILVSEVRELVKLQTEEIINREYVSDGDYLVVEEAIREYIVDFKTSNLIIDKAINDSAIEGVLSYENYVINGPEFSYNINLLNEKLSLVETEVNKLILMLDSRENHLYLDKDLSEEYVDLFDRLILEEVLGINKEDYLSDISLKSSTFKTLVNNCIEVLIFLKNNSSNWQLGEEKIEFYSDDLYEKYNELLVNFKQ